VLVSFVERGSEAAEAGMAVGDLIVQMEGDGIGDIEQFRSSIETIETESPFMVRARRGADLRFLLIVPREAANQARATGKATGS
jgi:S1-C subfamily serine protease